MTETMTEPDRKILAACRFIVISGLIGVGKTDFAMKLATLLGFEVMFEPVEDNEYLGDFYQDPEKWAYPMQEYLKGRRFALYQYAAWGIRAGRFKGVVMDRSIHEDTVFAEINHLQGNIDGRNWNTYLNGFQDMQHFLPEPDLYIYLDADPVTCKARADARDRPEERVTGLDSDQDQEAGIPIAYMRDLHDGYMRWLDVISARVPIVRLDWSKFRFVEESWKDIRNQIQERSRFTRSLVRPPVK